MSNQDVIFRLKYILATTHENLITTQNEWVRLSNDLVNNVNNDDEHPDTYIPYLVYKSEAIHKGLIFYSLLLSVVRRLEGVAHSDGLSLEILEKEKNKAIAYVLKHGARNCHHVDMLYFGAMSKLANVLTEEVKLAGVSK